MALLTVTDLRTYFHTRNGVYRAVGTATPALVGQTDSGVTQYDDTTAAIGTTYTLSKDSVKAAPR